LNVIKKIKKRDGRIADFDRERIRNAVHKALLAVELGNGDRAEIVTREVVRLLEGKFREKKKRRPRKRGQILWERKIWWKRSPAGLPSTSLRPTWA
jgi:hypothetical protein